MTGAGDQMTSSDAARTKPRNLDSVQVLRGVAALLVVFFHVAPYERRYMNPDHSLIWYFEYFGYGGVNLFFVISGFIICYITRSHWGEPAYWRSYMAKRIWRIYPVYWICFLVGLLVMHSIGVTGWCSKQTSPEFVSNIFLLSPFDSKCVLPQAWTLHWEMAFYLLFSLALLLRRSDLLPAAVIVGSASIILAIAGPSRTGLWLFAWAVYNLHFFLGAGVAILCAKSTGKWGASALAIGAAWFLFSGWLNAEGIFDTKDMIHRFFEFAISSALVVYGLVSLEKRGLEFPSWLKLLGDASYSIYLLHILVLWSVRPYTVWATGPVSHGLYLAVAIVLSCATGVVFHLVVEKPLLRRRLPWMSGRPSRPQPTGSPEPTPHLNG